MQAFWSKMFLRNSFYRLLARDTDGQRTTSNGKEQLWQVPKKDNASIEGPESDTWAVIRIMLNRSLTCKTVAGWVGRSSFLSCSYDIAAAATI